MAGRFFRRSARRKCEGSYETPAVPDENNELIMKILSFEKGVCEDLNLNEQ